MTTHNQFHIQFDNHTHKVYTSSKKVTSWIQSYKKWHKMHWCAILHHMWLLIHGFNISNKPQLCFNNFYTKNHCIDYLFSNIMIKCFQSIKHEIWVPYIYTFPFGNNKQSIIQFGSRWMFAHSRRCCNPMRSQAWMDCLYKKLA